MIRERTSAGLAVDRAQGHVGGRRKKLDVEKRREIAESVITGRKTGADMGRLHNISQPTVSRIVGQYRLTLRDVVVSNARAATFNRDDDHMKGKAP